MQRLLLNALQSVLMICLLISSGYAQKNLLNQNISGFENSGSAWEGDPTGFISVSTEKSFSGTNSFKYHATANSSEKPIYSIDTRHTIMQVRTAHAKNGKYLVAASYEGAVLGLSFTGTILWKNELSGLMVHDLWCSDLDNDGVDEVLVASADGSAYCLDGNGIRKWRFQPDEAPMYAITAVHKNGVPYVVCGGLDLAFCYLSADGSLIQKVHSSTYSQEATWGIDSKYNKLHYAGFLRPFKKADGTEALALLGTNNHMQVSGSVYVFDPLATAPYKRIKLPAMGGIGAMNVCDVNGDGADEFVLGNSQHYSSTGIACVDVTAGTATQYPVPTVNFGYLITHTALVNDGGVKKILALHGDQIHLMTTDFNVAGAEYLKTNFDAFNGIWQDGNLIYLASAQSGGSCIHMLDMANANWKEDFKTIQPKGKFKQFVDNTDLVRNEIKAFVKPAYQREQLPVYFIEGSASSGVAKTVYDDIKANEHNPVLLNGSSWSHAENWDRSSMASAAYRDRRDARRTYDKTQTEVVDFFSSLYPGQEGIGVWGGHGNDPYYFQLSTHKKVMDAAAGKKTILIFPELEDHSSDFAWVMNDLFYPMADYAKNKNAQIYVRTKHNFWYANAYLPMWKKLLDGEYPGVFVPSMEETTDKAMDLSIPARAGVWASGAINEWGSRSVPDNPSFDRARQFGYQRVPNHFLRHTVYMLANGATVINNFNLNPDYMSVVWSLIAKGALFIPKPDEILSYSPVHLSMFEPDADFLNDGSNAKWQVMYDENAEQTKSFVFGRLNGTWIGAQTTKWDFSNYVNGVKDRRQNFLPPMPNGMVLITPPQSGPKASTTAVRGKLVDHLHPMYKNIMKEYYTDGRYYYSADGLQKFNADTYYTTIKQDIENKSQLLPLTVSGKAAWVVAQLDPTHLRLTVVDGGYLSPDDRKIRVSFHSVTPVSMTDVLDGTNFDVSDKSNVEVDIPCGIFRFIDIELSTPLQ